jgi:hypothetical protein
MNGLYEDIDEDLDELDDEDFGEDLDELAERRKRKRHRNRFRPKGGGYNQPRLDKSPVSQTQMQAALARVGEDVKKLAASVRSLEERADKTIKRISGQNQGLGQMAMMMPMLMKKSVTVTGLAANGIPQDTRVLVDDNDSMMMLLPFMMMQGFSTKNGDAGSSNNDMMMMMAMMMAFSGDPKK